MGFLASNFNIGTVPSLIVSADSNPLNVHIHNNSEHTIYVGASDVATTTGLNILKQTTEEFYVVPGDELYAISNGVDRDVRVIKWSR